MTKAQKLYAAACDACRAWAKTAPAETLLAASGDQLARSYGIQPAAASTIISNARRERNL